MGCHPVVVAGQRSELSDPGLARRPALVGVQVGDGVVQIHPAGAAGGVGEHINRLPQPQMLPDDVGDFVGVDRRWQIVQVDDRLQQNLGLFPHQVMQPGEQHRPDVLHPGDPAAGRQRRLGKMHVDHRARPGPRRVERRRHASATPRPSWSTLRPAQGTHQVAPTLRPAQGTHRRLRLSDRLGALIVWIRPFDRLRARILRLRLVVRLSTPVHRLRLFDRLRAPISGIVRLVVGPVVLGHVGFVVLVVVVVVGGGTAAAASPAGWAAADRAP